MFGIIGYLLSLLIISILVTIASEYVKKFNFVNKLKNLFTEKIKNISWYQVQSSLIALIILIVLNILGAISLSFIAVILNAIIIGLLSNGIFTYEVVKKLLVKLKISSEIINNFVK